MRSFVFFFLVLLSGQFYTVYAQAVRNPIMFVTVVPNAQDSATQCAAFGSHLATVRNAARGGDLWIRYPDGSLKNLTKLAGYGTEGLQNENSIAVREPSIHWSGKKAIFSMIVGSPTHSADSTIFYWQLYEITGLGKGDTPIITKIPNQPQANNVSPIYGTKDNIIFISDNARLHSKENYPYLDENIGMRTNSGLWSLQTTTGVLTHLDHSPSGDFSPILDSYGRIIFTRWDILQQDQVVTFSGVGARSELTYSNEQSGGTPTKSTFAQEAFPEINPNLTSRSSGGSYYQPPPPAIVVKPGFEPTFLDPRAPNNFFPWAINEDGSSAQTINHIGRHDMHDSIPPTNNSDPNLVPFRASASDRANKNPIVNIFNIKEDPQAPGTYYGVDMSSILTHGGGQIVRMEHAAPTDASNAVTFSYITPRATRSITPDKTSPNPMHLGFFRNPLPTTDSKLIASYTKTYYADPKPANGAIVTKSSYAYRLVTMKSDGSTMIPDILLTSGISKNIVIRDYSATPTSIEYNGILWEVDPVEVVARTAPNTMLSATLDPLEEAVFSEESVDVAVFKKYLRQNNQALIVSRDITLRDKFDKLQPFNLRVSGTDKQSPHSIGRIYDVAELLIYQADYRRSYVENTTGKELPGRRILPTKVHDVMNRQYSQNPSWTTPKSSSVKIEKDGSFAALVPASRALTWQLSDDKGGAVVRERYWVNFAAGEIRACVKCHGENSDASVLAEPNPQNKSEGLRNLLRVWKMDYFPLRVRQSYPLDQSINVTFPLTLEWLPETRATSYEVTVKVQDGLKQRIVFSNVVSAPTTSYVLQQSDIQTNAKQFTWEVRAINDWGKSEIVVPFTFATDGVLDVPSTFDSPQVILSPNPASDYMQLVYTLPSPMPSSIIISDYLGRDVMTIVQANQGDEVRTTIPIEAVQNGIYLVRIVFNGNEYRKRLVISR